MMLEIADNSSASVGARRVFVVSLSLVLAASCIILSGVHEGISLAGVRVSGGPDISEDVYQPTQVYHVAKLFNPMFDADSPTPQISVKHAVMGENDVQSALARLVAKSSSGALRNSKSKSQTSFKADQLFNPSLDPDAPSQKLTSSQKLELAERRRDNQMKAKLKIEAQLAMLTERQTLRHSTLDKSHNSQKAKLTPHAKDASAGGKPNLASIEESVRSSLEKGDDPSKIITKELQSEMQVTLIEVCRTSSTFSTPIAIYQA